MSTSKKASEPSMDDILSSIRKIIAEEPIGSRPEPVTAAAAPQAPVEPKLEFPAPVETAPVETAPVAVAPVAAAPIAAAPESEAPPESPGQAAMDVSPFDAFVAASGGEEPALAPVPAAPAASAANGAAAIVAAAEPLVAEPPAAEPPVAELPAPIQPSPAPDMASAAAAAAPAAPVDDLMDLIAETPSATTSEPGTASDSGGAGPAVADPAGLPEPLANGIATQEPSGPSAFAPAKPPIESAPLAQSEPAKVAEEIPAAMADTAIQLPPPGDAQSAAAAVPAPAVDAFGAAAPVETAPAATDAPAVAEAPAGEQVAEAAETAGDGVAAATLGAVASSVAAPVVVLAATQSEPEPEAAPAAAAPTDTAAEAPSADDPAVEPAAAAPAVVAEVPAPPLTPTDEADLHGSGAAASDTAAAVEVSGPEPVANDAGDNDTDPVVEIVRPAAAEPGASRSTEVAFSASGGAMSAGTVRTMEDTVAELLRPMLRDWLDANMPRIMEKTLKIELAAGAARDRDDTLG